MTLLRASRVDPIRAEHRREIDDTLSCASGFMRVGFIPCHCGSSAYPSGLNFLDDTLLRVGLGPGVFATKACTNWLHTLIIRGHYTRT